MRFRNAARTYILSLVLKTKLLRKVNIKENSYTHFLLNITKYLIQYVLESSTHILNFSKQLN